MSKVLIQTTPTSYRIQVAPSGQLLGTDVNVYRHCQEFTEKEWDKRENRWKIKKQYRHYDRRTNTLFLPRYDLPRFTQMLVINQVEFEVREIPLTEGKPVELDIAPWFKPKSAIQAAAIRNCVNNDAPIRGIALQPGKGKAQPLCAQLKTPTGWIPMGDVKVGDLLVGADNTPMQVTGVFDQGLWEINALRTIDGRSTKCSREHLWKVFVDGEWSIYQTHEVRSFLMAGRKVYLPLLNTGKSEPTHKLRVSHLHEALAIVVRARASGAIANCTQRYGIWIVSITSYDDAQGMVEIQNICSWGEYVPMRCISVDHPDKLYVTDDHIVTHNTATSLVAAAAIGRRFLIKTPILLNQWLGSVQKFLSVKEDEIYIISGSGSIIKLLQEIDKTIFPKVILASLQTLRDYANDVDIYRHIPPMTEFIERINVGVVIEDEVHMHFHAALLTDMVMTPKVLIPMSATFEVTSKDVHPIFEGHFPSEIRFGEDQYDRYVHVSSYSYTLPLHQIAKSQYRTGHGYMHAEFEKDMLKKRTVLDRIMDEVYMPILYAEYFNYAKPGEKLLIICSRTEMCAYIMKYLRKKFPDKKIDMFISGSKESVKTDNDIVVSTVKSSGVGFDMPNLITTFVTVAADSPPLNKQLLGRLRELNGREPRLAYASCLTITSHVKYMNTRRRIFPSLAKEFAHYAL